jgi:hypothetical protein
MTTSNKRPTHGGKTRVFVCGPGVCPTDSAHFEHDNYFGCVPRDFNPATGKSKTFAQVRGAGGLYHWNGGCNG